MPAAKPARRAASTRLAQALHEQPRRRATPLDLFQLARRFWLVGDRIDVGALATRLRIARATAFRWVGSRDLLLGEILWQLCDDLMTRAASQCEGRGARRVAAICEASIRAIVSFEPLRRFVRQDPEFALRLLTSKRGPVQGRAIERVRSLLAHEVERGALQLPLGVDTLAYLIVRISESFIYAEVISDQQVDVADAALAVELLLSGRVARRTVATRRPATRPATRRKPATATPVKSRPRSKP
jgi:AcrR family transcriptional regulator